MSDARPIVMRCDLGKPNNHARPYDKAIMTTFKKAVGTPSSEKGSVNRSRYVTTAATTTLISTRQPIF